MRALMVGDVVGRPGRDALAQLLPSLRKELGLDVVVVNAENAAAGRGLTARLAKELLASGADVLSSGNHIYNVREFVPPFPVAHPRERSGELLPFDELLAFFGIAAGFEPIAPQTTGTRRAATAAGEITSISSGTRQRSVNRTRGASLLGSAPSIIKPSKPLLMTSLHFCT